MPNFNEFFLERKLQAACEELVAKHQLACEALTEKQIADAIRQAILTGDFQKLVKPSDSAQAIIYLPYSGVEDLREENRRLREKLQMIKEAVMELEGAMEC